MGNNESRKGFSSANMSTSEKPIERKVKAKDKKDIYNNYPSNKEEAKGSKKRIIVILSIIICVISGILLAGVIYENNRTKSSIDYSKYYEDDDFNRDQKKIAKSVYEYLTQFMDESEFKNEVSNKSNKFIAPCVKKVIVTIIEEENASYAERAKKKMSGVEEYLSKKEYEASIEAFDLLDERAKILNKEIKSEGETYTTDELEKDKKKIDDRLKELIEIIK